MSELTKWRKVAAISKAICDFLDFAYQEGNLTTATHEWGKSVEAQCQFFKINSQTLKDDILKDAENKRKAKLPRIKFNLATDPYFTAHEEETLRECLVRRFRFEESDGTCDDDPLYEYTPKPELFDGWVGKKHMGENVPDVTVELDKPLKDCVLMTNDLIMIDYPESFDWRTVRGKEREKWFTEKCVGRYGH